jgi:hypothetical protein
MGVISINTRGSFPCEGQSFNAEFGGHANAIQRAIKWLNDRLPAAIELDHKLHDRGERPPRTDFGLERD